MGNCLSFLVLVAGMVSVSIYLSGRPSVGLLAGYVASVGVVWLILKASRSRHQRLVREWADMHGVTDWRLRQESGCFIDPADMPWWRGWTAYDLWGQLNEAGENTSTFS
jgi:hypothetical protein